VDALGYIELETGSVSGDIAAISLPNLHVDPGQLERYMARVKLPSIANVGVWIGFGDSATDNLGTSAIGFEFTSAGGDWVPFLVEGGPVSAGVTSVAATTDWVNLELRDDGNGTFFAYIDGVDTGAGVTPSSITSFNPYIVVKTTTAAPKTLLVDWFGMRMITGR
jgi:hypothetical protein